MWLQAHQRRRFWQDTFRDENATVVVHYAFGLLIPTVYIRNGGIEYPASIPASLFVGPDALDQREWEMGLIAAALGSSAISSPRGKAADPALEKTCPTLHAFMVETEEDGKPRSPSSLVVFTEDGQWKGCLSEKDAGLQLWRTAETLQKLFQALEKALASGQADWRKKWAPEGKGKGSRGRRG